MKVTLSVGRETTNRQSVARFPPQKLHAFLPHITRFPRLVVAYFFHLFFTLVCLIVALNKTMHYADISLNQYISHTFTSNLYLSYSACLPMCTVYLYFMSFLRPVFTGCLSFLSAYFSKYFSSALSFLVSLKK